MNTDRPDVTATPAAPAASVPLALLALVVVGSAALLGLAGCGGGPGSRQPPPVGILGTEPATGTASSATTEVPVAELLGPFCGGFAVGVSAPGAGRSFPVDVRVCQAPAAGYQYWLVAESTSATGGAPTGLVFPKAAVAPAVGEIRSYPVVLGPLTPLDSLRLVSVVKVPDAEAGLLAELQRRDASALWTGLPASIAIVSNVYRSVLVRE